jgi:hypothetical protein
MQGAPKTEIAAGFRRAAVLVLALFIVAFALQPCFATVLPSHPCCPKPSSDTSCHKKAHVQMCTMGQTSLATPEKTAGPGDVGAEAVVIVLPQVPAPLAGRVLPTRGMPPRGAPFLLNHALLI